MCGIAAIFAYHSSAAAVDRGELTTIRDAMTTRGPDGHGEWYSLDGRVGLGHRRLSIIDLSPSGAQPMKNQAGTLVITFNGEIYNYRELRSRLEKKGYRFQSTSDTEVLLHLYAEQGESMVDELRGMYVFALWDEEKKGLFLARDPLGIKPLYYADDGKTIRIASQVKALLAGGHIDTAAEPAGHVGYFLWGHVPEPHTLYRGIKGLPVGTTLWIDETGNKRQKTFCSVTQILAEAEEAESKRASSDSQLDREMLRSLLEDSVRKHLIADVPVGIFLSSGIDSTVLTALAAGEGGTLRTVTLGFEEFRGTANDETPLAAKVAQQYGAVHETIWVTRADFRSHFDRVLGAMDQPSIDGVNTYFVSLAAVRASLKVALSGLGGDELFGGYPSFREIPRAVKAFSSFGNFHTLGKAMRVISAPVLKRMTSPKYAGLFEYGGTFAGAYLLRRSMFMPWELPEFLDADMIRQGWQDLQPVLHLEETLDGLKNPWLKVSCLEMSWYMRNQLLRDSDWAGMAHSLEIRVPLVDVELLKKLAPLMASDTPPKKRDLADAPVKKLPAEILNRPKTGFQIPVRDWLMGDANGSTHSSQPQPNERGLRGWARGVYANFTNADTSLTLAKDKLNGHRKSDCAVSLKN